MGFTNLVREMLLYVFSEEAAQPLKQLSLYSTLLPLPVAGNGVSVVS